jgi:hypothetical protein
VQVDARTFSSHDDQAADEQNRYEHETGNRADQKRLDAYCRPSQVPERHAADNAECNCNGCIDRPGKPKPLSLSASWQVLQETSRGFSTLRSASVSPERALLEGCSAQVELATFKRAPCPVEGATCTDRKLKSAVVCTSARNRVTGAAGLG